MAEVTSSIKATQSPLCQLDYPTATSVYLHYFSAFVSCFSVADGDFYALHINCQMTICDDFAQRRCFSRQDIYQKRFVALSRSCLHCCKFISYYFIRISYCRPQLYDGFAIYANQLPGSKHRVDFS